MIYYYYYYYYNYYYYYYYDKIIANASQGLPFAGRFGCRVSPPSARLSSRGPPKA